MIGISTINRRLRLETPILAYGFGGVTYSTTLNYIFPFFLFEIWIIVRKIIILNAGNGIFN